MNTRVRKIVAIAIAVLVFGTIITALIWNIILFNAVSGKERGEVIALISMLITFAVFFILIKVSKWTIKVMEKQNG